VRVVGCGGVWVAPRTGVGRRGRASGVREGPRRWPRRRAWRNHVGHGTRQPLRSAALPPLRRTGLVLVGGGLRRLAPLLGAPPRRHVAERLPLCGPLFPPSAVPGPLPRLLRRRRRCHHPALRQAWWRRRRRLRPACLGAPPPLWPRLCRVFRRPPRRRQILWRPRRAPHRTRPRCRPLSRVPPLLGHDPALATRVTMSDARCRNAARGAVDAPPALGAEAGQVPQQHLSGWGERCLRTRVRRRTGFVAASMPQKRVTPPHARRQRRRACAPPPAARRGCRRRWWISRR